MFSILKKLFGSFQDRKLTKCKKYLMEIEKRYNELVNISDAEWRQFLSSIKQKASTLKDKDLNSIMVDAFAAAKLASKRILGKEYVVMGKSEIWDMVFFDEQIMAGVAMFDGGVAEMQTGEGKTLTAVLPLYLRSLTGKPVFSITINDYLAQRDCEWMKPLFNELGVTVAYIKNQQDFLDKKRAYSSDVVYGTASEFGFDYLRDNSSTYSESEVMQRGEFYFALIDEIDHILINEAKTPLIISGNDGPPSKYYGELRDTVEEIVKKQQDKCDNLINEAEAIFNKYNWLGERTDLVASSINKELEEATKKLWIVSKGMPEDSRLLAFCEYGNIRSMVDRWEVYFAYDHNKEEMHEILNAILATRDEKTRDFELTETGIHEWSLISSVNSNDFEMIDIINEIENIEKMDIPDEDKKIKIVNIQQEDSERQERSLCLKQLLYAYIVTKKDVDYVIENGEIVLLDESTGRLQYGRKFSKGLQQAIESKERLKIQSETKIIASITIQNLIRLFPEKAGMSGTAIAHEAEFKEIYNLEVISIPTHKMSKRIDFPDKIFVTKREKIHQIISDIKNIHKLGRPILVGTYSIEESEFISNILSRDGIPHKVLSAKNHKLEAEIIAKAGQKNAVTIATNMAGRGTDIRLAEGIADIGGMHVIVASRGKSRSQDLQFRGRQGRQGDPGSCQFFVSFEDSLLRTFQSPVLGYVLQNYRPPEGEEISSPLLSSAILTAQERLEHSAYQIRKNSLDYDDVINIQRKQIYSFRKNVITSKNKPAIINDIIERACFVIIKNYRNTTRSQSWHSDSFRDYLMSFLPIAINRDLFNDYVNDKNLAIEMSQMIIKEINRLEFIINDLIHKSGKYNNILFVSEKLLIRSIVCKIDEIWRDHLDNLEELRQFVQLRSFGQKDPLIEFRKEALHMFDSIRNNFDLDALKSMMHNLIHESEFITHKLENFQMHFIRANKFKEASEVLVHE